MSRSTRNVLTKAEKLKLLLEDDRDLITTLQNKINDQQQELLNNSTNFASIQRNFESLSNLYQSISIFYQLIINER